MIILHTVPITVAARDILGATVLRFAGKGRRVMDADLADAGCGWRSNSRTGDRVIPR